MKIIIFVFLTFIYYACCYIENFADQDFDIDDSVFFKIDQKQQSNKVQHNFSNFRFLNLKQSDSSVNTTSQSQTNISTELQNNTYESHKPNTTCIRWRKLDFMDDNNNTMVPFNRWVGTKKVREKKVIIFNECKTNSWKNCEQEIYAIERKRMKKIRKIDHSINTDLDDQEGIYASINPDWPNTLIKMTNEGGVGKLFKLCELKASEKAPIEDVGWIPLKIEYGTKRPPFREDATMVLIRSFNPEAIEGDTDYDVVLFGGHSDIGNFDDIWVFSTSRQIWMPIDMMGEIPAIEGYSAVVYVDPTTPRSSKIIIFGGNIDGKASDHIYMLDIRERSEMYIVDVLKVDPEDGPKPVPREGHSAFVVENKIVIVGGCNFGIQKCYNDIWALNIEKLPPIWIEILVLPNIVQEIPSGREGFGFVRDRNSFLMLHGCSQNGLCFKEIYEMDIIGQCIFKCPLNSKFEKGKCVCARGWGGPNCDRPTKPCAYDCNINGICLENGICKCNEDYFGFFCEHEYCLDNCGESSRGFCRREKFECECKKGNFGSNCLGNCNLNCHNNGYCVNGTCVCQEGFFGKNCEERAGIPGCWKIGVGDACFALDVQNNKRRLLKGAVVLRMESFVYIEDPKQQIVLHIFIL